MTALLLLYCVLMQKKQATHQNDVWPANGAGDETRTRDFDLGKVALYQLSYSRVTGTSIAPVEISVNCYDIRR